MASFIELPRLTSKGADAPSVYVNTADIIAFQANYDGQTVVDIRDVGNQGMSARVTTTIPTSVLAGYLDSVEWATNTRDLWAEPHRAALEAAAR